jgi:glycolate oxidase
MASGVTPVAMEFLDNLTIKAVEEKFNRGLDTTAGAMLISEVDGNSDKELQYQLDILEKSFVENGCKKFVVAQDNIQSDNLWFARKNASQSLSIYGNKKINEDITVPRSCLPELLKEIEMIGKKYSLNIPCFGHTGDGNVHVNVMIKNKDDKKQLEIGHQAIKEIFQITIDLGGTLSGEHGIGISKAPFMSMAFTKQELELFRTIKKAFDPNNILNPNKMGL